MSLSDASRPSQNPRALSPLSAVATHCFAIRADATPGMMSRVLELFAKRYVVPTRWLSEVFIAPASDGGLATLKFDILMEGLEAELAAYVARCLRQIFCVDCVLTSTSHVPTYSWHDRTWSRRARPFASGRRTART
jgi:hypothetical protein